MKGKIIEIKQQNKIECDLCDFVFKNDNPNELADISEFVNKHCPECHSNLLTPEDYLEYLSFVKLVNRANKWLGWLSYLFRSQTVEMGESTKVKIHDGLHITK